MLNDAQMKKLQKQVGKKVDVEIKKRDDIEKAKKELEDKKKLANLIEMRKEAQALEDLNKDRGTCFVLWEGNFYGLNHKTNKMQIAPISMKERFSLDEPCKIGENKTYFFLLKDVYDQQKKLMKFMSENYATVKFAVNAINRQDKESVVNALMLGDTFKKFQSEFIGSSMLDFIQSFRAFDSMLLDSLR
jgi:hypothetical protein